MLKMPRIDPIQLLNCLSVLLSPNGGIKSRNEVQRLAGLMTKFSKKLVSKCIYIQILKCTETNLLGSFMGSGGWSLVHMWLSESISVKNWPLVNELLELLLLCPVDIERLKTNNCPKLVKELSKDGYHNAMRALASKLVEQWLKIVKGEQVAPICEADIAEIVSNANIEFKTDVKLEIDHSNTNDILTQIKKESTMESNTICNNPDEKKSMGNDDVAKKEEDHETLPVLKISMKDGKQVISQLDASDVKEDSDKEKSKIRNKTKSKDKLHDKSSSSTSKSSSKHYNKSRSSSSSTSEKHKSSSSSSSKSSSSSSRSKEKHSSRSSRSRSDRKSDDRSSKSRDDHSVKSDKEKYKDKEKERDHQKSRKDEKTSKDNVKNSEKSDEKSQVPSIHKLGKIPKLSDVKKEKPSISIEIRKPDEPKPKTVKTFHSKFRKHGLEEEVKPPPPRAALLNKKPPLVLPPTVSIPKRPSPVRSDAPPEKKIKTIDAVDKPGAIKLIPAKPKPMMLLESDMFMDALNASATNKKEPKKRKRRTSGSKDGNSTNDSSPPHTPTALSSPNSENKSVPPRFYQDTLESEDNKDKSSLNSPERKETIDTRTSKADLEKPMEIEEPHTLTINGLKGVLCYHKRKGPKKSIRWKPDTELEEIQYFELDETERVNVTKTFTDMKYLERIHEREAFQKGRNLSNDDIMEEKTSWRPLILIEVDGQVQVDNGKNSKEKDIQAIRQKGTLQPLYFHKSMIPDSPNEPDIETHTYSEPTIIPLDDITGNQDNISDFRNMPWPEPRGNGPPTTNVNIPPLFPPNMPAFPNNFPNSQYPVVPGFQGRNMVSSDWQNGIAPHIIPNGIPAPINPSTLAPGNIPPGALPPGVMLPSENIMIAPEMFGGPNSMFSVPPEGFKMPQNMFPMEFNMPGPQGPGHEVFSGPGNFRGAMRGGRGVGGHWRGKSGGNWDGGTQRGRGGPPRGGRKSVCIYFQRKGSCRQGDNCSFLHPGVNCPF